MTVYGPRPIHREVKSGSSSGLFDVLSISRCYIDVSDYRLHETGLVHSNEMKQTLLRVRLTVQNLLPT